MTTVLEGIKVLDFGRLLPVPFTTWMLGDFGAEIIHVEEPARTEGRRAEQAGGAGRGPAIFLGYIFNRNKKSIVLNLKTPQGRDIALKLARRSDILVEEMRPGVMKRLGLDYETVSKLNPRIIYCSQTLYGQTGPYKDHPGHGNCGEAMAGIYSYNKDAEGKPTGAGVLVGDCSSGLHAVIGILLALHAREVTGQGQHIDISMVDAALDFQCSGAARMFQGMPASPVGPNPFRGVWQCRDSKWLCTSNTEPHHWANFCRTIGREDFIPQQQNEERRMEMAQIVKEILLTKTREEWLNLFWGEIESQAAPVYSFEEVWQDPQVLNRNMVVEVNHPKIGKVKQLGHSIKLEKTPAQIRSLAPTPGQHTDEILASLGYDKEKFRSLKEAGVVA